MRGKALKQKEGSFCAVCSTEAIDLEMNSSIGGQRAMSTFKSWAWVPEASLLPNDRYTGPSITMAQSGQAPGQGLNHLYHTYTHTHSQVLMVFLQF